MLAEGKECATFGLLVGRQALPFGAADRTEENGIALLADLQGLGGKSFTHTVDRGTADEGRSLLELESKLLLDGTENLASLGHDFGADAVSGQHCDAVDFVHRGRMH